MTRCPDKVPSYIVSETESKLRYTPEDLKVRPYRILEAIELYPSLLREFYERMLSRGVYVFPKSFRRYVLDHKPERIENERKLDAIRASVIANKLSSDAAIELIDSKSPEELSLLASLIVAHPKLTALRRIPKELQEVQRFKQRAHAYALANPEALSYLAKAFKRKEFYEDAIRLYEAGFFSDALSGLIATLEDTNDGKGLAFILEHGSKGVIEEALERIITDIEGLKKALIEAGCGDEEFLEFLIKNSIFPDTERFKEYLEAEREKARKIIKRLKASPRKYILLTEKYEFFDEALEFGKLNADAVKVAADIGENKVKRLIEKYGVKKVLEAAAKTYDFRTIIDVISALEKKPRFTPADTYRVYSMINTLIYSFGLKFFITSKKYRSTLLELADIIAKSAVREDIKCKFMKFLLEIFDGLEVSEEELRTLKRFAESLYRKKMYDCRDFPRIAKRLFGRIDKDLARRVEDIYCFLRLIPLGLVDPEAAKILVARAQKKGIKIPLSLAISLYNAGIEENLLIHLLKKPERLHFEGFLSIAKKDLRKRTEYVKRASLVGYVPDEVLRKLAEAYKASKEYIPFLYELLNIRSPSLIIARMLSGLDIKGDKNLLYRAEALLQKHSPAPEAIELIASVFENTGSDEAIRVLLSLSPRLSPEESLEAMIAMKKIKQDIEKAERFSERIKTIVKNITNEGDLFEGLYKMLNYADKSLGESIERVGEIGEIVEDLSKILNL